MLKTEGRAGMPQHLLIERTEEGHLCAGCCLTYQAHPGFVDDPPQRRAAVGGGRLEIIRFLGLVNHKLIFSLISGFPSSENAIKPNFMQALLLS